MKTSFIAAVVLIIAALFSANLAQARDRVVIVQDRGYQHPYGYHGDHYNGNHRHYRSSHRRNHYNAYPRHYPNYRQYSPVVRYRGPVVTYINPRYCPPRRW